MKNAAARLRADTIQLLATRSGLNSSAGATEKPEPSGYVPNRLRSLIAARSL
ncbi:hypothetical protein RP726_03140 [Candidatus Methylospira mobilis]|uniref:hypothetical protein n=1 Tax=Candidatus Methylospira mobilis TaxID=1808979 RepID=UPI0028EC5A3C|nr:hypothetical protein [Candidatus Methylospira mobilis]WNV05417.1 hypothetical protein RP726_03140 [Candidatus Methylospira mobilis]